MIGSDRDPLVDRKAHSNGAPRMGGPLAALGVVLAIWVTGRAILWESPFAPPGLIEEVEELLAEGVNPSRPVSPSEPVGDDDRFVAVEGSSGSARIAGGFGDAGAQPAFTVGAGDGVPDAVRARIASALGHRRLWQAALTSDPRAVSWLARQTVDQDQGGSVFDGPVIAGEVPPTRSQARMDGAKTADRWSLDAWAFLREGSGAAPISQGRVPVYGASQMGARLRYSLAPSSGYDPRLYARGYRALIDKPETEIAAGGSLRPVPSVPLRLAAEVRATDNDFTTEVRPALYAITEIPPVALPLGLSAEIYAGAGYVGGQAQTAFADGQASVLGELGNFDLRKSDDLRISVGAGAWAGAQRDASRLDVGPTMRVQLAVGSVPARLSIDYRERVGRDASPVSGLAATLSTQF